LEAELQAVTVERDAAIAELNRLRRSAPSPKIAPPQSSDAAEPKAALTITELPATLKPADQISSTQPARSEHLVNRHFAGFWFYAKLAEGQNNKNKALYPPEYIEASITESGGAVHGTFRSRFQIADRLIPPDVNFSFYGVVNGTQIDCPWSGAGGAKGDVTLKLVSDNSLRIDWVASDLGTQQGLSSGTAVLTRRIE